jgi:hypothetical protein
MAIRKNRSTYSCPKCEKINIQINMVDSVLWNASFGIYIANVLNANVNDRIAVQKQIMDIDTKIKVANKSIEEIESRMIVIEEKAYKYTGVAIYPKYTLGVDIPVLVEFEGVEYAIDVGEYVYTVRTTEENYLLDIKGILIIE